MENADLILDKLQKSGFDTDEGLYRVGGSFDFYSELLIGLCDEYKKAADEFLKLKDSSDQEPARRLIHSIKGVSGNLGAKALHQAARNLEEAVKNQDEATLSLSFPVFKQELESSISTISVCLGLENKESLSLPEGDEDFLKKTLLEISRAALSRKAQIVKSKMAEINAFSWPSETGSKLESLSELIKKYKLKEAAEKAATLVDKTG